MEIFNILITKKFIILNKDKTKASFIYKTIEL